MIIEISKQFNNPVNNIHSKAMFSNIITDTNNNDTAGDTATIMLRKEEIILPSYIEIDKTCFEKDLLSTSTNNSNTTNRSHPVNSNTTNNNNTRSSSNSHTKSSNRHQAIRKHDVNYVASISSEANSTIVNDWLQSNPPKELVESVDWISKTIVHSQVGRDAFITELNQFRSKQVEVNTIGFNALTIVLWIALTCCQTNQDIHNASVIMMLSQVFICVIICKSLL